MAFTDQRPYDDASKWFKAEIKTSTKLTTDEMRKARFQEGWVHGLLYYRTQPNADENTYTLFRVPPEFLALQAGVKGLISSGFVNENHFGPSAWCRSLARGTHSSKGTNRDSKLRPSTRDPIRIEDRPDLCSIRGSSSTRGSISTRRSNQTDTSYGVSIYTISILNKNAHLVQKVFQDKYHARRDVYLAKLLVHLKISLTVKMPSVEGSFGGLFQPKPTKTESIALDYLSGLSDPSLLSPRDYVMSTTKKLPRLRYKHMVITWNKMRSHFSSSNDEKFKLAFSNTKALSIKLISDWIE
ncbi:hypothetical protein BGX20_004448, partial [Mortierella sp. AD010]